MLTGLRLLLCTEGSAVIAAALVAPAGLTLMVPTRVSAAALLSLVAAVELQVRLIEEQYRLRVHGSAYRQYASTTGRFLPGIGRVSPSAQAVPR